jgi:hypothetical protein
MRMEGGARRAYGSERAAAPSDNLANDQMRVLQLPAVHSTNRNHMTALMAIHLVWGSVLWFSISKYGLGISTDSVHLLFGGQNLAAGNGLISYDGSFLTLWPPLYPALLGLVHLVTGTNMLAAATIVQAAAFVGLSLCTSILFLRIFEGSLPLAAAATVLADIGAVVLTSFDVVGSDYVGLCLAILSILLTGYYIESHSGRALVGLTAVGMLAMLDRYLFVAAIATSAVCVFWLTGSSLRQKLARGLLVCVAAVPAGVWLGITSGQSGRRTPISFAENFSWFSKSILEWFFPAKEVKAHLDLYTALLWVFMLGLMILVSLAWNRRRRGGSTQVEAGSQPEADRGVSRAFVLPILGFGAVYVLAVFGSASIAYFNKLGGRFLLPVYIPFITLLVSAVAMVRLRAKTAGSHAWRLAAPLVGGAALIATAALLLQITLPLVSASHTDGATGGDNAFNTKTWNKNQAIQYWRQNPPQGKYALISNDPDAVAFFTGHTTLSSPRSTSGPYSTDHYALSSYPVELFATSGPVYLIWIEPSPAAYFYTVEDIATIATVEPEFVSTDGGVYRLTPKPGP